jgi:DNA primase
MSGYKELCNECGKDNLYITPHNGMQYCFTPGCNYRHIDGRGIQKKRIRSTYINDIRTYYKIMAEYYHSNLDRKSLDYLYSRGFNDSMIEKQKIGYCPKEKHTLYNTYIAQEAGLLAYDGTSFLGDRIIFPYFKDKNTVVELRGRSIDKDPLRYKSPFGDSYYRGSDYPYNYQLHNARRVILTEGEIKANIALQLGYNTMALPGMGIWKQGFKQSEDQEVIILFDSQKDMQSIRKAIDNVAARLLDPKVATLPLMNQAKMDIDIFIIQYGESLFATIIDAALPYQEWKALQLF